MIGTQRDAEEDSFYWRITHWLLPHANIFGGVRGDGETRLGRGLIWSAVDDHTTAVFSVSWALESPLTESERDACEAFSGAVVPGSFMPLQTMANDYLIDRERQATETFTGIESLQAQDLAAQEGMGRIVDRTEEHLGSSDSAIIRVRRALIRAARDLMEGTEPPQATRPASYKLRTVDLIRPAPKASTERPSRSSAGWGETAPSGHPSRPDARPASEGHPLRCQWTERPRLPGAVGCSPSTVTPALPPSPSARVRCSHEQGDRRAAHPSPRHQGEQE